MVEGRILGVVRLGPEWGELGGLFVHGCGCGKPGGDCLIHGTDDGLMLVHQDCVEVTEPAQPA